MASASAYPSTRVTGHLVIRIWAATSMVVSARSPGLVRSSAHAKRAGKVTDNALL